jgi:hypothetical protein
LSCPSHTYIIKEPVLCFYIDANVAFIPAKQIGIVALCSCDSTDAHMGRFDFVLLHLTGQESLSGKSESKSHTASNPLER